MMTLSVRYKVFLLLVCLGLALVGCRRDEEAPEPTPIECLTILGFPDEPSYSLPRDILTSIFPAVPEQIMLTGLAADIDEVVADGSLENFELTRIGPSPAQVITFPPPSQEGEKLTAALFRIGSSEDISTTIQAVYSVVIEKMIERQGPVIVLAEANRFVAMPWGVDADPWGVDADPWGVDADPAAGGAAQAQIPGESVIGVWNQWALVGENGVGLYDAGSTSPKRLVDAYGEGVDVVIFDTSPFPNIDTRDVMGRPLCVYHPELPVDIPSVKDSQVRQHGLFVAGLVRFVAPNSHMHLVRILNEDGVGEVFSFLTIISQLMAVRDTEKDIAVNLSLSLQDFKDDQQALRFGPNEEQKKELVKWLPPEYHRFLDVENGVPLALEMMMREVQDRGAVIVAASGNGSDLTVGIDAPAGMPARFVTTLGVAGSNIAGTRSCFSNRPEKPGGLLAPAGEGVPDPHPVIAALPGSECHYPFPWRPASETCPASHTGGYDCQVALTSVIITGTGEITFAHWLGTSFATPLVSGAAALILDAGENRCDPVAVTQWLRDRSGVLNVQEAVDQAPAICP